MTAKAALWTHPPGNVLFLTGGFHDVNAYYFLFITALSIFPDPNISSTNLWIHPQVLLTLYVALWVNLLNKHGFNIAFAQIYISHFSFLSSRLTYQQLSRHLHMFKTGHQLSSPCTLQPCYSLWVSGQGKLIHWGLCTRTFLSETFPSTLTTSFC